MNSKLKGYRVRVTVDLPIWCFNKKEAIQIAESIVRKSHSASKIMSSKSIREGLPDNRDLFPEDYNPSKRNVMRIK